MRSMLVLLLLSTMFAAVPAQASAAVPAQVSAAAPRALGNQPYASYWHPNTILNWSPASDPDARFNRGRVPLRQRAADPALKANANARAGEGRVASLVSFAPTSNNPSQGGADPNYYAFGYWQYIDTLVFWGGSASEGLILAPNPTVIDAAHRNGVKVYGTVFFPPTAYGGQLQWVRDFVQKSGSAYPVLDKLAQVAQHYGFEGWFINQETAGGDAALATEMRNAMRYARSRGPVEFMWYDAMTESGSVSWQDALNSNNDAFLQEGGTRVSDSMFLDFGWGSAAHVIPHARPRAGTQRVRAVLGHRHRGERLQQRRQLERRVPGRAAARDVARHLPSGVDLEVVRVARRLPHPRLAVLGGRQRRPVQHDHDQRVEGPGELHRRVDADHRQTVPDQLQRRPGRPLLGGRRPAAHRHVAQPVRAGRAADLPLGRPVVRREAHAEHRLLRRVRGR